MLRRTWIIAFILVNVSYATPLTVKDLKAKFLQLQVKIEFTITFQREDLFQEVNKLDAVLNHFHRLVENRGQQLRTLATHKQSEQRTLNRSINHCLKGLKLLSKNLDLYSLHKCKKIPYHVEDNLLEAKKLSLSVPTQKHDCILKHGFDSNMLRLCLESTLDKLNKKQLNIFRTIKQQKKAVFETGLTCIQENYNILNRELCMLTCQFEECVAKKCKFRLLNKRVVDKSADKILL